MRKSRAISPVIATVILVAVAVVIAAAMAGFAGSLFGVYSQNAQVKISSATFSNIGKTVTLNFVNTGSSPDQLLTVSCPFGATTLSASGANPNPNPATLRPNSSTSIVATFTGTMPNVGQAVTVTAVTATGSSYPISVIVTS